MTRRFAGLLLIACLLLSLFGCHSRAEFGQGFRLSLPAEPVQLDPQVATDTASVTVLSSLFEGLTRLDEHGAAQPALATWTVSPDGLTYTFTLKDTVWHTGETVTADDFLFAITRLVSPATRSSLSAAAYGIVGAQDIRERGADPSVLGVWAVDARTLEITLREPDSSFPETVASSPFYPCRRAFFEGTRGRYGMETEHILSNGPFALTLWTHGEYLILDKSDTYHDATSIAPSRVRYLLTPYDDPVAALTSGNIDVASLTASQAQAAAKKKVQIVELRDTVQCLWFNNEVAPLEITDARCALRDALEWEMLLSQLETTGQAAAAGLLPPDTSVGGEPYRTAANILPVASRDDDAASLWRSALTASGQAEPPTLTLLCADDAESIRLAQLILQSWQKNLSLYWELQPLPATDLAARVQVGNYQLALYAATGTSAAAFDAMAAFGSTAAQGNLSRFHDNGYDDMLTALKNQPVTREEVERLERYVWEQAPCVPLSYPVHYMGVAKDITGLLIRPFGGGAYGSQLDLRSAMRPDG